MDKTVALPNIITPADYARNQARLKEAKLYIAAMEAQNESGRQNYEMELLQKVREGDEARQILSQLEQYHGGMSNGALRIEAGPSSSRIEEVSASPQPQNPQWMGPQPNQTLRSGSYSNTVPYPAPQRVQNRPPPVAQNPPYTYQFNKSASANNGQQYFVQAQAMQNQPDTANFTNYHPSQQTASSAMQVPSVPQGSHGFRSSASVPNRSVPIPTRQSVHSYPSNPRPHNPTPIQQEQPQQRRPSGNQLSAQARGSSGPVQQPSVSQPPNRTDNHNQPARTSHYRKTYPDAASSSLAGALGGTSASQNPRPYATIPLPPATTSSQPVSSTILKPIRGEQYLTSLPLQKGTASAVGQPPQMSRTAVIAFRDSVLDWDRRTPPSHFSDLADVRFIKDQDSVTYVVNRNGDPTTRRTLKEFFDNLLEKADEFDRAQQPSQHPTSISIAAAPPMNGQGQAAQGGLAQQQNKAPLSTPTPLPTTPAPQASAPLQKISLGRSPADANKKSLAKDILFALGKRKLPEGFVSPSAQLYAKRQAMDPVRPAVASQVPPKPSTPVVSAVPVAPARISSPSGTSPAAQIPVTVQHSLPQDSIPVTLQAPPQTTPSSTLPPKPPAPAQATPSPPTELPPTKVPNTEPTPAVSTPAVAPIRSTTAGSTIQKESSGPAFIQGSSKDVITPAPSVPNDSASTSSIASVEPVESASAAKGKGKQRESTGATSSSLDKPVAFISSEWMDVIDLVSNPATPEKAPPAKGREPLFLPSPATSPAPPSTFADAVSVTSAGKKTDTSVDGLSSTAGNDKSKKKKQEMYVRVPTPPPYVIRHHEQEARTSKNAQRKKRSMEPPSAGTGVGEEEVLDFELVSENNQDPPEVEAVQQAFSRLQELPCRWGECGIIMNSVDALIRHLNQQHKPTSIQGGNRSFICRWTQCGRQCNIREKHLEKHASLPLRCAYQGCDESYRSASQLLKHSRSKHVNGVLKPAALPFVPKSHALAPVPKEVVPSYVIMTAPVNPTPFTEVRKKELGSWILRNIASSDQERPVRPVRSKKTARTSNLDAMPANNTYQFLSTLPVRFSSLQSQPVDINIEDLDSAAISREIQHGLAFWGPEEEEDASSSEESERSSSPLFSSDSGNERPGSNDEDAVQQMLTEEAL